MKKLLLIFTVFAFSCLSANATVSVIYNNAGSPVSVAYGYHRPIPISHVPQYTHRHHPPKIHRPRPFVGYGYSNGHVGPYVGIQQPIVDGNNNRYTVSAKANISRLNKNFKIPTPPKTHAYGGLTYYY